MIWWKGKDEESVSVGVANGIGEGVWSVEKNGVTCPPPRRNERGVGKSDGVCPPRQIGVGKNDEIVPPQRKENDVDDVSSHCFLVRLPLPHPPYASSDDSCLFHGPSLDPSHEKTPPSTAFPSRLSQLPRPSASVPISRPLLSLLELHGRLELEL